MSSRIAFQGHLGAYSHLACLAARPDHEPLACGVFDDVFDALDRGDADLGMIPVENSHAGRVADIHRLLPQHPVHIVGEHHQPVHHQLLAVPGATLETLDTVHSHPQALAQVRRYLRRHHLRPEAATDTAGAARAVAEAADPRRAAVASSLAGEHYGLEVLAADIEDDPDNTTRFLIIAREPLDIAQLSGRMITSCMFDVRNLPAALYKALGGFATNGINLLKLESHQLQGFAWTRFSIDFAGHPDDPPVARALEELGFFTHEVRILGTYAADPWRRRRDEALSR